MGLFESSGTTNNNNEQYEEVNVIPVATLVSETDLEAENSNQQEQQQQQQQPPSSSSQRRTTTTSTTTTTISHNDTTFGRHPMLISQCPNCNQQEARTRIETFPVLQTCICAFVLLLIFWPICWIPLVFDNCKRTNHYCVSCGTKVGVVEPFSDCCVKRRG